MLQVLMYAFPSMMIIISLYLFMYRTNLAKVLKLEKNSLINMFSLTFFIYSLLGFLLNLFATNSIVIVWMVIAVILTAVMIYTFYKIHQQSKK